MSELKILVTDGETRAALAAVRSLGAAGHTVHVLGCTPRPLAGASRHAVATHRLCDGAAEPDRFATEVADLAEKIGADLVLPIGEVSLGALYSYPTLRSDQMVAVDRSSFDRAVDKHALLVLAEELGFVGVSGLLGLFYYLCYRGVVAARSAQDRIGTYICLLVVAWITGQMAINIGMVLGRLPTIGVPMPLISYGGSSLISVICGIALIASVRARRFVN